MRPIKRGLVIALIFGVIFYYGIPIIATFFTPIITKSLLVYSLLLLNPIYALTFGYILTAKYGFKWYYPVCIAVLFIPAVYILYNDSALIYVLAYGTLALVSSIVRVIIQNKMDM